jgi:hypothetical protein
MGLMPRGLRAAQFQPRVAPIKCQAIVEDYANGRRNNLVRVIVTPKDKPCSRIARIKLGNFCFCALHAKLAQDGLINHDGHVAPRGDLRDVRRYPNKFPNGLYDWARCLTPKEIP